ncbi:MAG: DUF3810 domain-containing protein [Clostridiales bacterium]|nr:DUF3810 domain-containing protein [Clostridiales bacterium]
MKPSWKRWIFGIILPVVLIVFLYVLQMILTKFPSVGEAYAKGPFLVFSFLPSKISNLFPISLTEVFVVTLVFSSPILIAWLVIRIVRAVKEKRGKKYFFNAGRVLAWAMFGIYLWFMLLHGLNYTRYSLDDELGFGERKYTVEELEEVFIWVVNGLNESRAACEEDENGVATYPGGTLAFLNDVEDLYEESAKDFPMIKGNSARPKFVALSHYWSYTDIVGMYFPFFAEANVNTDIPLVSQFYNACHELSHLHGYAVENDANLAAILVCLNSDCPQLRYAGFREAFDLIWDDLWIAFGNDREGYVEFMQTQYLLEGYFVDTDAIHAYWDSIEPPKIVEEISDATNDAYLKANQQKDGVKSYNMPTSTVADYYFTYVKGRS